MPTAIMPTALRPLSLRLKPLLSLLLAGCALLPGLTHALVILQYHHVDATTPAVTSVSPEVFREHMALLDAQDMNVVNLEEAMQLVLAGEKLPERAVAITFDDAYLSVYENAWPELKKRGWSFTMFTSTDPVDKGYADMMSWDQLREIKAGGAVIANHTRTHPYLLEVPEGQSQKDWWRDEIQHAEKRIKEETGASTRMFAYPYGEYSLDMAEWLSDKGYIAFGQQSGAVGSSAHPQVIARFPASGIYANVDTLKTKLLSLPFTVSPDQVRDPVLTDNPPQLKLEFVIDDFRPAQVQCYAAGVGEMDIAKETSGDTLTVTMQQSSAITAGRGRYNCTAPSISQPGRFYWYSQLWVNMEVSNR